MNEVIKLKCGCEIPIVDGKIHIDYNNLNHNCKKTWGLYSAGHTRSVFQLESRLCQMWAKEINPASMKDAAALIAGVRPGVLNAQDENGKSMMKVLCDRKNGVEHYNSNGLLNELLTETYSVLIYQEDLLKIAKTLAGFDSKNSTKLLKSIGKKDAQLLFSLEKQFIEGCITKGLVTEQEAKGIFENIKNSARYLFNKCLDPDSSFVETPEGEVFLSDLMVGDSVLSPNGFIEVLDIFDTGEQDCYEITLESGKTVTCTMYHKFLCEDGKVWELYDILKTNKKIITQK